MTTTRTPPSTELRKLQATRDRLHEKVREARAKMTAHDHETQVKAVQLTERRHTNPDEFDGPRPQPGTDAAKLAEEVKRRRHESNPHADEFDAAFAPYEQADLALQAFKRERVHDRLAELDPEVDAAIEALHGAYEVQLRACEQYVAVVEQVGAIVRDTPGLAGTPMAYDVDDHVYTWAARARDVLANGILRPKLSFRAEQKLEAFNG